MHRPPAFRADLNAACQQGNHRAAALDDLSGELGAHLQAVYAVVPCTDHRDGDPIIQYREAAFDIEYHGRGENMPQPLRIGGILQADDADVLFFTDIRELLGQAQITPLQHSRFRRRNAL